ncbi:ATP-binding protein [Streptomyces sp. MB22_4]|uniref:ATP-binding protein n=1 Tax=Streptomyces sp. MB22_4 TaxID=3383120 RepID=UPI0039A0B41B
MRETASRPTERAESRARFEEYRLAACLRREVTARDAPGAESRIPAARFSSHKSLEDLDLDFDDQRSVKRETGTHLRSLDFVVAKKNIISLACPERERPSGHRLGIRACLASRRLTRPDNPGTRHSQPRARSAR